MNSLQREPLQICDWLFHDDSPSSSFAGIASLVVVAVVSQSTETTASGAGYLDSFLLCTIVTDTSTITARHSCRGGLVDHSTRGYLLGCCVVKKFKIISVPERKKKKIAF
jgi:hypothetical protein